MPWWITTSPTSMITEIKSGNTIVAFLVDGTDLPEGAHPVTGHDASLQFVIMNRKAGYTVAKHTHQLLDKTTTKPQKALVVTKGKLTVILCDREGNDVGVCDVSSGQCLFLAHGGYKIDVMEDALFFEFKNGPHIEDK